MFKIKPADLNAGSSVVDVREVGRVVSVREFIVKVDGLPSCMNGQEVTFANGDRGMVMGYSENSVQVLSFGNKSKITLVFIFI